mmetsp:Transcript_44930/g.103859  ORF Transcript_44930/g.103859 Transcript_44930/m.103859 type:complete len:156 (-) Transcript_44930:69-536(-)
MPQAARLKLQQLNWQRGVHNFDGDEELYRVALEDYPRVVQTSLGKIQAAHQKGDLVALRDVAWRMQGSAAYMAAQPLHAAARDLVSALGDNNADLQPLVLALVDQGQAVCEEARAAAMSSPCEVPSAEEAKLLSIGTPPDQPGSRPARKCNCTAQ